MAGTVLSYRRGQTVFSQGEPADSAFYIQKGGAKLTVLSNRGKEAVLAILEPGNFFGEGCLAGQRVRMATVVATRDGTSMLRIENKEMMRASHAHPKFSDFFLRHLLSRNIRIEEDLVDQLFNSTEKRLARAFIGRSLWQWRQSRNVRSQDQPGNPGRDDRDNPRASQFFYEQVPEIRVH